MILTSKDGFSIDIDKVQLVALHERGDKAERCGVMLGKSVDVADTLSILIADLIEVPNSAVDKDKHFQILGKDVKDAVMESVGIGNIPNMIGAVHTHTQGDPDPSFADIRAAKEGLFNFVFHPKSRTLTMFNTDGYITKFTYPKESKA